MNIHAWILNLWSKLNLPYVGHDIFGGNIVITDSPKFINKLEIYLVPQRQLWGFSLQNNMGVAELEVDSFTISSRTEHTWSVDRDLSLLTVRLNGVSSPSMFTLDRPDGNRVYTPLRMLCYNFLSIFHIFIWINMIVLIYLIGITQIFSGSSSVDVVGSTIVLSIQVSSLIIFYQRTKYTNILWLLEFQKFW